MLGVGSVLSTTEEKVMQKDEQCSAGLMRDDTGQFSIPLYGVHLLTRIVNFCAKVTLRQRYYNPEKTEVSATYV